MYSTSAIGQMATNIFALPLATLALMIGYRYEIHSNIRAYSRNLSGFVTAQVEQADAVSPSDVHEWSDTLRYAFIYRKSSKAVLPVGYACIASWLAGIGLSALNPFGMNSWVLPIIQTSTSTMAAIFSFGMFSVLVILVGVLFYIDHSRISSTTTNEPERLKTEGSETVE